MIKGVSQDILSRGFDRGSRAETPKEKSASGQSFADQLFGARTGELESPDRTERKVQGQDTLNKEKPGRETPEKVVRGGRRSDESEFGSKSQDDSKVRANNPEAKKKDKKISEGVKADVGQDHAQMAPANQALDPSPSQEPSAASSGSEETFSVDKASQKPGERSRVASESDPRLRVQANGAPSDSSASWQESSTSGSMGSGEVLDFLAREGDVESKIMSNFLEQMQREFGVSPEAIVEAFAKMDQTTLMSSPEKAVSQFVQNLGITPENQPRVAVLYQNMVDATGDAVFEKQVAGNGNGVDLEVLSQKDIRLRKLSKALDDLNDTFFNKNNLSVSPMGQESTVPESIDSQLARLMIEKQMQGRKADPAQQVASKESNSSGGAGLLAGLAASGGAAGVGLAKAMTGQSSEFATMATNADGGVEKKTEDLLAQVSSLSGNEKTELAEMFMNSGDSSSGMFDGNAQNSQNAQASAMSQSMNRGIEKNAFAEKLNPGEAGKATMKSAVTEAPVEGAATAMAPESSVLPGAAPLSGTTQPAAATMGPSSMILSRQPTPQDEAENVQELMKQAQVILKRGGGEMKLEMKPEGMGQVQLKVSVDNGQVNIQMLTDNDAAKKALERGLSDLKANLAAQQLKVESMRVDVGNEIQKQMDQNQDSSREQARQFAQDFMSQFREERQGFRQGLMEGSGMKSYGPPRGRAAVDPEPLSVAAKGSKKSDASRRLNLVA